MYHELNIMLFSYKHTPIDFVSQLKLHGSKCVRDQEINLIYVDFMSHK